MTRIPPVSELDEQLRYLKLHSIRENYGLYPKFSTVKAS
jgi:hypothetical protein